MNTRRPFILITPDIEIEGKEFHDLSISLSANYSESVAQAGGLPFVMTSVSSEAIVADLVARCDGVMLTGGDDVDPRLYSKRPPRSILKTVNVTPDGGARDFRELTVIHEVFRQKKPLLAICRGHQLLNVSLGGTLVADIPQQVEGPVGHRRRQTRGQVAHEVRLTPDSLLAKITGTHRLRVNSTHHQAVGRIAGGLTATACADDGVVEALELEASARGWLPFLLSVQFHPERLVGSYPEHLAIFRAFIRACVLSRKRHL